MNEELFVDEKEFSWSLSRDRLLDFCPRAYFYHYYGSAGGFEDFSGLELLYQLKHILPLNLWINSICTDTLRDFFYENYESFNINKAARRYFNQGARSISLREWRNDPLCINLFEAYYGLIEVDELIEQGEKLLDSYIGNLFESGIVDYLGEIPYLDRKNFSFPISSNIGRIKVWFSPALIWQEDGLLKFLNLKNTFSGKLASHHSAAMHKIYALNTLRINPERVVTLNFNMNNGETTALYDGKINVSGLIEYVKESSARMLSLISTDNRAVESFFQKNESRCHECRFKKYCVEKS